MASYKVPQDVEADDKLIGPFSFRQFIYLIIVAMAIALAWALGQLFIGLAIIPLPVIILFGALALPLRKDQPMEIYMAAMVSYLLKPRLRKWDPEGVETLIEISAPKTVEVKRTKDLSQNEAEERLSYLANIVDSGGWAIRGVANQQSASPLNNDIFLEAQGATDILDTSTPFAHNFDQMMSQSTARVHDEARERMMQATLPASAPQQPVQTAQPQQQYQPVAPQPAAPIATAAPLPADDALALAQQLVQSAYQPAQPQVALEVQTPQDAPQFNPYPTFHQSVIQPLNDTAHEAEVNIEAQPEVAEVSETANTTSEMHRTTDIINLANNSDLSIETIAHEAQRINKKAKDESDEIVISLR